MDSDSINISTPWSYSTRRFDGIASNRRGMMPTENPLTTTIFDGKCRHQARRRSPRRGHDRAGFRHAPAGLAVASAGRCSPNRDERVARSPKGLGRVAAAHSPDACFSAVPRADEAICIDWARGESIDVLLLKPGRALPLYAGAAGRVTLAFGRDDPRPTWRRHRSRPTPTARRRQRPNFVGRHLDQDPGLVVSDGDVTDGIGASEPPVLVDLGTVRRRVVPRGTGRRSQPTEGRAGRAATGRSVDPVGLPAHHPGP